MVCVVHNFKGKLLLNEESAAEQPPNTAMLNMGRMESPLEKYIASQVSRAQHNTPAQHTHLWLHFDLSILQYGLSLSLSVNKDGQSIIIIQPKDNWCWHCLLVLVSSFKSKVCVVVIIGWRCSIKEIMTLHPHFLHWITAWNQTCDRNNSLECRAA